VSFEMKVWWR